MMAMQSILKRYYSKPRFALRDVDFWYAQMALPSRVIQVDI